MPRFSRGSIKTSYVHVMTQGINKSYIFDNPEDIKYYIKIMYKLLNEHSLKIIAYCIMNNHTHMLIHAEKIEELSKYMQRLNGRYALYYNKKYDKVGYVFRDRYRSEGIYSEKQYYTCIKYIYDNPVKAGMCDRPEEYPYSNYRKIPTTVDESKYTFIDIEEDKEKEYIGEIELVLEKNNVNRWKIRENEKNLKTIIKILKDKYKLSYRKIEGMLNIGRETVRKLYNS